ncbi:hypothetical protein C900_04492 [Fulvivirga imtechensis AK7]|uniref:DUF4783 domain-containing protein n=1 Tax=Fulvivirga imtechensis AK7 TaxID=1237149 RepID=L8JR47_9BACT|nr:DUF4783 domain-containing protein [Fulvivirga imtechensis]ELR69969.1 hypothetical protein C900_04492 [Fulvivirga imtechensis AK7]
MNFRTGRILFLGIVCGLAFLLANEAFSQGEIINDVKEAIKTGSSKEIAKFLNQNVDVTLDGNMQSYSKTQAEFVLKDFFKNNPPSSFTIVHQGASKGGLPYAIGQYMSKDDTYRVWLRIKNTGNKYLIHEISFIKE